MLPTSIISTIQSILDNVGTVVNDDSEIIDKLTRTSGLVGLVGIGFELYKKVQDNAKSPAEKAFGALLSFSFNVAEESLKELLKSMEHKEITLDKGQTLRIMKDLLKPFKNASDWNPYTTSNWNSYLPQHPVIEGIKLKISYYLQEMNHAYLISQFQISFDTMLTNKAVNDDNIKQFYKWWNAQQQQKAIVKYLDYVQKLKDFKMPLDQKSLQEYYVKRNALFVHMDTWEQKDKDILADEEYNTQIKDVDDLITEFMQSDNADRWFLMIGASFGMGKSSSVRMLAANHASKYLNRSINYFNGFEGLYIPIFVRLRDNLNNVYNEDNLEFVLNKIVAPNEESARRQILLILDGADEYPEDIRELLNKTVRNEMRDKYPNMKVILTTRLKPELPDILKPSDRRYLRLLPFTEPQVDEFLRNYYTKTGSISGQTYYSKLLQLKLREEEISKPLFTWMFAFVHSSLKIDIEPKENWTRNMWMALIYLIFFNNTIRGKYKDSTESNKWKESYIKEKRALRRIAAIKQIKNNTFTEEEARNILQDYAISSEDRESILTSHFTSSSTLDGRVINFIHESFKEYLIAEYYLESLFDSAAYRLSSGTPSEETIEFLIGLLDLLTSNESIAERFVAVEETSLLRSLGFNGKRLEAIEFLKDISLKSVKQDNIIFRIDKEDNMKKREIIWREAIIDSTDFKQLWIHRWISLVVFNVLKPREIDRKTIVKLIKYSSHLVPGYLKILVGVDLSSTVISSQDDLDTAFSSEGLFSVTYYSYSNSSPDHTSRKETLTFTPTGELNIQDDETEHSMELSQGKVVVSLEKVDLDWADLSYALLNDASFTKSTLSRADLSNAVLNGAYFDLADLSNANFIGATMQSVGFWGSDLRKCNMQKTIILNANFNSANISGSDLSFSIILGCKWYENLLCKGADFSNAIIENEMLVKYLRSNNAKNVPDAVTNAGQLKHMVTQWVENMNIDKVAIDPILSYSLLDEERDS